MGSRIEFFSRIIGAVVGAAILAVIGNQVAEMLAATWAIDAIYYVVAFGILGALIGFAFTPMLTVRPMGRIRHALSVMPSDRLVPLILGIFLGLVGAALFSIPLSQLPSPFREILPLASALGLCYLSAVLMMTRYKDLQGFLSALRSGGQKEKSAKETAAEENVILLDTSVIIDGRITDISRTGFIRGTLLVPNFILKELQHIADSADSLRRNRGRRGLEVLGILQNNSSVPIRFSETDVPQARDADSKLVALARRLNCPIMTNDYNLNRVAELQGITVLNINDLANAVRVAYLPGEELSIKIIQEGKEYGQGVGYLEDGTMVVVEDGFRVLNRTESVTVTKVLQTTAGRMIFAKL
jgi:uncharacterized protein YacL